MKRSEINQIIKDALMFFESQHFFLPPWARWSPEEWETKGEECNEIRNNGLGWDLTDFGSGDFNSKGLTLFTIRNGHLEGGKKTYCEKIMLVRNEQVTPAHFHWYKTEDIINRGGGVLCMRLWHSDQNEAPTQDEIWVQMDGITKQVIPGDTIRLQVGESITFEPLLYHSFWAEEGDCIVGEVSTVNDDAKDNRFWEEAGRFPEIEEDVAPAYTLCTEYLKFQKNA
ncbi:D-lyxose/D-mannose family sugar isomerase [Pedobacter gandavensis]|uniref:D-lyxose ketol-isomerase n=1 Tax=Pedobacter gandavensis TaxID=2679963 RepID=A0ABR6EVZ5_9SPHI|nr:D-lyxose/D-mannose family sugar isomerase [Pedobacter gandavensis]MBB2148618.1 D-lyxose/D-mannose family sugar isomerase [Pedobacter gandavensis]